MTSFSLTTIAFLCVGGAVGVLCRYLVSLAMVHLKAPFIFTNLVSNSLGAGFLGWALAQGVDTERLVVLFLVGLCGGLSTLSGIWVDVYKLGSHQRTVACVYVVSTLVLGLLSFLWAGQF